MVAIAGTNSSPYTATLLDNIASSAGDVSQSADAASNDGSPTSQRPSDSVVLSDRAKQILARAATDKAVADRLAAFVQSLSKTSKPYGSQNSSDKSSSSSNQGPSFEELAGLTETSSTTVTITATGNGITAPNGTDAVQPDDGGIHPARSFSNTLSFGDFYITAKGDSLTDNSDVEIYAKNLHASSVRWGGYSGTSGVGDGGTGQPSEYTLISGQYSGNRETFIFAKNSAAVSAVAAQNANGTAVQATAAEESDIVAITVDFETGQISASEVRSSAYATLTGIQRIA